MDNSNNQLTRIIRLPEVLSRVGLGRSTLYYMIKDGQFPKQIILGPRSVGWIEAEINAWIRERINNSRNA